MSETGGEFSTPDNIVRPGTIEVIPGGRALDAVEHGVRRNVEHGRQMARGSAAAAQSLPQDLAHGAVELGREIADAAREVDRRTRSGTATGFASGPASPEWTAERNMTSQQGPTGQEIRDTVSRQARRVGRGLRRVAREVDRRTRSGTATGFASGPASPEWTGQNMAADSEHGAGEGVLGTLAAVAGEKVAKASGVDSAIAKAYESVAADTQTVARVEAEMKKAGAEKDPRRALVKVLYVEALSDDKTDTDSQVAAMSKMRSEALALKDRVESGDKEAVAKTEKLLAAMYKAAFLGEYKIVLDPKLKTIRGADKLKAVGAKMLEDLNGFADAAAERALASYDRVAEGAQKHTRSVETFLASAPPDVLLRMNYKRVAKDVQKADGAAKKEADSVLRRIGLKDQIKIIDRVILDRRQAKYEAASGSAPSVGQGQLEAAEITQTHTRLKKIADTTVVKFGDNAYLPEGERDQFITQAAQATQAVEAAKYEMKALLLGGDTTSFVDQSKDLKRLVADHEKLYWHMVAKIEGKARARSLRSAEAQGPAAVWIFPADVVKVPGRLSYDHLTDEYARKTEATSAYRQARKEIGQIDKTLKKARTKESRAQAELDGMRASLSGDQFADMKPVERQDVLSAFEEMANETHQARVVAEDGLIVRVLNRVAYKGELPQDRRPQDATTARSAGRSSELPPEPDSLPRREETPEMARRRARERQATGNRPARPEERQSSRQEHQSEHVSQTDPAVRAARQLIDIYKQAVAAVNQGGDLAPVLTRLTEAMEMSQKLLDEAQRGTDIGNPTFMEQAMRFSARLEKDIRNAGADEQKRLNVVRGDRERAFNRLEERMEAAINTAAESARQTPQQTPRTEARQGNGWTGPTEAELTKLAPNERTTLAALLSGLAKQTDQNEIRRIQALIDQRLGRK